MISAPTFRLSMEHRRGGPMCPPVSRNLGTPDRTGGDSPRKGDAAALSGKATKSGAEPLPYRVVYR